MNRLIILIFVLLSFWCKAQPNAAIELLGHSPIDTVASWVRSDYILYSYLENNYPINAGTEFWIKPGSPRDIYKIKATNSIVVPMNEVNTFLIFPNGDFQLSIYKGDKPEEEILFNAVEFKAPIISVIVNELPQSDSVISVNTDSLEIRVEQPDLKYRRIYPKDCQYIYESITVTILRNGEIFKQQIVKTNKISLRQMQIIRSDQLTIEVNNLKRKNSMGRVYPVLEKTSKAYLIE